MTIWSHFYPVEYPPETLNETSGESRNESNWHTSKLFFLPFLRIKKKKKKNSSECMGTDQLKTMRITVMTGQSSQAFCHSIKWSNVKIYYSYYYKYIYKKRNHFYLWILQGIIDLVNKVLSQVCTYFVLIRKLSLCSFFSVPFLMVQYEKKIWQVYEYYWAILYCNDEK